MKTYMNPIEYNQYVERKLNFYKALTVCLMLCFVMNFADARYLNIQKNKLSNVEKLSFNVFEEKSVAATFEKETSASTLNDIEYDLTEVPSEIESTEETTEQEIESTENVTEFMNETIQETELVPETEAIEQSPTPIETNAPPETEPPKPSVPVETPKPTEPAPPPETRPTPAPTEPVVTEPPVTNPPETEPPITEPPATEPEPAPTNPPAPTTPPVCTNHDYKFSSREVSDSYQIYNVVIDTYECSVCGSKCTETKTVSNVSSTSSIEAEIVQYINNLRTSQGLNTLWSNNGTFNSFAKTRAHEISYCFGHARPDGSEASISDGTYYVILEDINAGGYSAYSIFNAFVNSNAHYRALVYSDAVGVAVGMYVKDDGTAYTVVSIISAY